MDRIERFKPDFKRHLRPMPGSVEHVEKAQDAIRVALDELEDIQKVYSNFDIDEGLLEKLA